MLRGRFPVGPEPEVDRSPTSLRAPSAPAALHKAGIRPSLGSIGDCFNNAMCESFFATLECELLDRRRFATKAEARMALFHFIEAWYDPHRRHSALGYDSPVTHERKHHEALAASYS